jgi:hypothetical protein
MTKPFFAVQITGRDDHDLHRTVDALCEMHIDYATFGLIPMDHEITNLEAFPTDRVVIPLAGTNIANMYIQKELPPNWRLFYDRWSLDQRYYSQVFGSLMLNHGSEFKPFRDAQNLVFDRDMFVKPSNDLKMFAGMVLDAGTSLAEALAKTTHQHLDVYEPVMISECVNIGREFRIFIVDNEFVDASEYRNRSHTRHKKVDAGTRARLRSFFYTWVPEDTGIDTYALDVGEVGDDLKIIELNCYNCSGMYEVDRGRVFEAVENRGRSLCL